MWTLVDVPVCLWRTKHWTSPTWVVTMYRCPFIFSLLICQGVFIANQIQTSDMEPEFSEFSKGNVVESRITFNEGASWSAISAPKKFNFEVCNKCDGDTDCHLHLHGTSSWNLGKKAFPAVYSHKSAPGFVMASGNVGGHGHGLSDSG